jgi:hypothetical protein
MRGEELTTGCRFQLVSRSCPAQLRQQRSSSDSHCPNKKHVCIRGVKLGLLLYLVGSAQKSDTTQQYAKFQTHTCISDPHMPEIKQDTAAAKVPRLYRHACSLYGQSPLVVAPPQVCHHDGHTVGTPPRLLTHYSHCKMHHWWSGVR